MPTYHTVEQGEHLSGIALKYGFPDYRTIWNHSENAELKKKRQNPHVLFPGDRLFVPDKEAKEYSRATEQRHRFQLSIQPMKLRIQLERAYDRPLANTECELTVESDVFKLTSDSTGKIEHDIPKTARNAQLTVKQTATVKKTKVPLDLRLPVKIGDLDPVEEPSGQVARLANLGYYRGSLDTVDREELRSAIEEFQCEHPPLAVTGTCDAKTQARLKEAHGC
jgi:N-acetylmuramoyl-L-alanine amidase